MRKVRSISFLFAAMLSCAAMASEPTAVFIEQLDLTQMKINAPDHYYRPGSRTFELTEKEQTGLQAYFHKTVIRAFESAGQFVVVDDVSLADVVIAPQLNELSPTAPKDDFRSRGPKQEFVTRGAGTAKVVYEITKQDDYVISLEDRMVAGTSWGRNDRMSNARQFRQAIKFSASRLHKAVAKQEA